uniref:Uncharacterized protein n=1 Tax=Nelumbo nucifera TaxID=4432 RepID=A0A822YM20_NELNU|nr:TPA_asm: hypothetical protein HUJ06_011974 [Nelumbo nucifera]
MGTASFVCSTKFLLLALVVSAVPVAFIISLERSKSSTHVYEYHGLGWLRESGKWDDANRRFLVSNLEGGIGQIPVPEDHASGTVLQEQTVVRDADLAGNASLGIVVDPPRNRLLVAISDLIGNRYTALAAYDLTSWNRLFLTQLSGKGQSVDLVSSSVRS